MRKYVLFFLTQIVLVATGTSVRAEINLPGCDSLNDREYVGQSPTLAKASKKLFGIGVSDLTNEDIDKIRNHFSSCKRSSSSFLPTVNNELFDEYILRPTIEALIGYRAQGLKARSEQAENTANMAEKDRQTRIRDESIRADSEQREVKAAEEKRRSEAHKAEVRETQRKYWEEHERQQSAEREAQVGRNRLAEIGSLFTVFSIADFCAKRGAAFKTDDVKKLSGHIQTLADKFTKEEKDEVWRKAQTALKMSGFESMNQRDLNTECLGVWNTVQFTLADQPKTKVRSPF